MPPRGRKPKADEKTVSTLQETKAVTATELILQQAETLAADLMTE